MVIHRKYNKIIKNKSINRIVLRLQRKGCKFYPVFDLVVLKKKHQANGRAIDKIGVYNPNFADRFLFINTFKLAMWLDKGLYVHKSVKKYVTKFLVAKLFN
jgi:ribosomal protein S16